jgi:mRNA interferase RelE/StbE
MASYEIVFRKSVAKDLRVLPKKDVQRVLTRIRELSSNPRPQGCEKLSGLERYRIRQSNYRIVYEIQNARLIVLIVKVAHRKDVYRG